MLNDITLGQYFPGNTVVHRLDPRIKLCITLVYIITLFIAKSYVSYGVMTLVFLVTLALSRIKPVAMFRGLKPILFIIVITAILNIFYSNEGRELISFWKLTITDSGLIRAGFMVLRVMLLILGTFLLTYTTTPLALTDALERLLTPLKKLRVPVHEMSMMMSIALRFIPTLIEEANKTMSAQKARGADFETGKLRDRARALLPLLIPLFVSAFRRADELAVAMESRCYTGGEGRTRMKVLRLEYSDYVALILSFLMMGGVITLARFGL